MAIVMEIDEQVLAAKFGTILPHLDERQRRLLMAAEARSLGYGGISLVARAAGVSRVTVTAGVDELDAGAEPLGGRARRPGGGRKPLTGIDAGLQDALDALVEPETRGDPMTRLRWTTKSTRNLSDELGRQGHQVSHHSVGKLLAGPLGYSLQGNAKTLEGRLPGPRRPVPLHQPPRRGGAGRRRAGDQRGREKERADRGVRQQGPRMAAGDRPAAGGRP